MNKKKNDVSNKDVSNKKWIWTDEYLIHSYEADARGTASLSTICKFLQETAYRNADHLGFGYTQLKERNQFWVLSRILIRMERYPRWDETVQLRTWPSGVEKLFAFRDFQLLDEAGVVIGSMGTTWLVLDAERRRPRRPEIVSAVDHLCPKDRALDRRPGKVLPLAQPQPAPPSEGDFFPVRYSDLDLYHHVNNAVYVQWILDGYPQSMHREHRVKELEINFLNETVLGDEAAVLTEPVEGSPLTFRHSIKRKADNRDVCLAQVVWTSTMR